MAHRSEAFHVTFKAGVHQISKIAVLELAEWGVRMNLVNPDAVFGDEEVPSKLWELVGPERMKSRGLDPQGPREYYRQRNLLKARVMAEHVGNVVVFLPAKGPPRPGPRSRWMEAFRQRFRHDFGIRHSPFKRYWSISWSFHRI